MYACMYVCVYAGASEMEQADLRASESSLPGDLLALGIVRNGRKERGTGAKKRVKLSLERDSCFPQKARVNGGTSELCWRLYVAKTNLELDAEYEELNGKELANNWYATLYVK